MIIPAYNEQDRIDRCLRAVLSSAHHPVLRDVAVRIVAVLDSCSDGTSDAVEQVMRRLPQERDIKLVAVEVGHTNVGLARADGSRPPWGCWSASTSPTPGWPPPTPTASCLPTGSPIRSGSSGRACTPGRAPCTCQIGAGITPRWSGGTRGSTGRTTFRPAIIAMLTGPTSASLPSPTIAAADSPATHVVRTGRCSTHSSGLGCRPWPPPQSPLSPAPGATLVPVEDSATPFANSAEASMAAAGTTSSAPADQRL